MPPAPPSAVRGFIVGSWVGGVHPDGPPAPVITEFMSVFKALPAEFGAEILHLGPALKQYEMGAREGPGGIIRPPIAYAFKFASKAKAAAFFDYPPYVAFKDKYKIGSSEGVLRDMRIIEGPSDMFKPGMSYWLALVHNVVDSDMFLKYFGAFAAQNEKGFALTLPDGAMTRTKLEIKYVGGSDFREEALKFVPSKEEANPFVMGASCEDGLVVIAEIGGHAEGAAFKECTDYKAAMLSAFDLKYTDEAAYKVAETRFVSEVFRRDVRVIGIPAEKSDGL